jgi:hypothetical protein
MHVCQLEPSQRLELISPPRPTSLTPTSSDFLIINPPSSTTVFDQRIFLSQSSHRSCNPLCKRVVSAAAARDKSCATNERYATTATSNIKHHHIRAEYEGIHPAKGYELAV